MSTPTGADAMKEAERLLDVVLSAHDAHKAIDRYINTVEDEPEDRRALAAASEALARERGAFLAHIRKLVEAQPAAVAGEAEFHRDPDTGRTAMKMPPCSVDEARAKLGLNTGAVSTAGVKFTRHGIAASPAAPAGVPTEEPLLWAGRYRPDGKWTMFDAKPLVKHSTMECYPVFASNSFHRSAADASEASGSAIPARPTLPGEDAPTGGD